MRVAVLGGTGMLGPGVVGALASRGHDVLVLHRGRTQAPLPAGVRTVKVDRREPGRLAAALAEIRPQALVDLTCYDDADASTTVEAARDVPRVLVVSTVNVYGGPIPTPLDESTPPNPVSSYGREKLAAEAVFRAAQSRGDCDALLVRLGPIYRTGAYLDGQLAEDAYWLGHLAAGRAPVLADEGAAIWNVLHADDAGLALALLVENDLARADVVLLGSTQRITWRDYYALAYAACGRAFEPVSIPIRWIEEVWDDLGFLYEMSMWDQVYDVAKLERLAPGWGERVALEEGLADAVRWLVAAGETGDPAIAADVAALAARWESERRMAGRAS